MAEARNRGRDEQKRRWPNAGARHLSRTSRAVLPLRVKRRSQSQCFVDTGLRPFSWTRALSRLGTATLSNCAKHREIFASLLFRCCAGVLYGLFGFCLLFFALFLAPRVYISHVLACYLIALSTSTGQGRRLAMSTQHSSVTQS